MKTPKHSVITRSQLESARTRAADLIRAAGIVLTVVQTERISVKLLVLFAGQTEPEHWHPRVDDDPGKEETVRVVSGTLYFYREGEGEVDPEVVPVGKADVYTCAREVVMRPGDQITLPPGEKHWFQAREEPVVMYSFSTIARDGLDGFSDPAVERATTIAEH